MKHLLRLLFIAFILFSQSLLHAQAPRAGATVEPEDAAEHFSHGNYVMALPAYLTLLKKEPKNVEYNYRIGICYLKTNGNKKLAIPYLEMVTKQAKFEYNAWLYLGQAYHSAMRFDEAYNAYKKYQEKASDKEKLKVAHYMEQCQYGKALVKLPLNVTFENLGKDVNSEFPDYYPYVTSDESMLVYTSRRKGNMGASTVEMDGYYASDIWMSKTLNGVFQKTKNAGPAVNGNFDDQAVGLSADGKWMTVYVDNIDVAGDLYFSANNRSFAKSERMEDNINNGFETAGSLSPDGNIFFFASKRDGTKGETDIWMVRKLPNGKWSMATNIEALNTPYREDFPFMSPDGKTMYFSSEGHNSMGGLDLFMSTWNEEENTWSTPKNVGYPINTPDDNYTICFTENNRIAYVSMAREGGLGDLDIWRVVFNEVQENSFTVVTGQLSGADTASFSETVITVSNAKTQEEVGVYKPNPRTGRYVLALPPGKYIITIDSPGCKPFVDTIFVFDVGAIPEMKKDVLLIKQ